MLDRSRFLAALRSARRLARRTHAHALRIWRDPARRERAAAQATFALIAVCTLASVDYLIAGGGPDWNPVGAAYALEAPPSRVAAVSAPVIAAEAPPPLPAAKPDPADYSVTAEVLLGGPEWPSAADFLFEETPPNGMSWR